MGQYSHSEAWSLMGLLLESHSEWVTVGRSAIHFFSYQSFIQSLTDWLAHLLDKLGQTWYHDGPLGLVQQDTYLFLCKHAVSESSPFGYTECLQRDMLAVLAPVAHHHHAKLVTHHLICGCKSRNFIELPTISYYCHLITVPTTIGLLHNHTHN